MVGFSPTKGDASKGILPCWCDDGQVLMAGHASGCPQFNDESRASFERVYGKHWRAGTGMFGLGS